jgi:hypothetical protein
MERRFPQLLEAVSELGAHARRDVAVDTTHARHLMPHPLRLEHVTDAQLVEPGLVTVA